MVSESCPARTDAEVRWQRQVDALVSVAAELRGYGIDARSVPDQARPYVRTAVPGVPGVPDERILVGRHDWRSLWAVQADLTHPITDPAGAARRIATRLRREAERAHGTGQGWL